MKTLKFKGYLVKMILDGTKTTTWRIFDDKDLQVGDELEFVNSDTGEIFARAKIMHVREKKLGDIDDSDYTPGHKRYASKELFLKSFQEDYGNTVNFDTMVKIVTFELIV